MAASRRALARDDEEILLFTQDWQVVGWIHYQFEAAERYLQTCAFNVCAGTENALAEFLEYIKKHFPGYEVYLGFPKRNQEAMYRNSDRLLNALERWKIYLYEKNGYAAGAIYYMDEDVMLEIFGVDFPGGIYDIQVFKALLTKALNEGKKCGGKYFCFFTDSDCHPAALSFGFRLVGEYVCFRKRI